MTQYNVRCSPKSTRQHRWKASESVKASLLTFLLLLLLLFENAGVKLLVIGD